MQLLLCIEMYHVEAVVQENDLNLPPVLAPSLLPRPSSPRLPPYEDVAWVRVTVDVAPQEYHLTVHMTQLVGYLTEINHF